MARRRSNKTRSNTTKQSRAYPTRITNRARLRSAFDKKIDIYNSRFVEDRRTYNPSKNTTYTPRTISGKRSRVVTRSATVSTPSGLKQLNTTPLPSFAVPSKTLVCVRRKQRKEVLHAYKKTGTGGQKKPRRNQFSNISC